MTGPLKLARPNLLHDPARVHHQHAVAERGDELEVVADEDQPHAALGDEVVEDAQHFELHRHVERRGRLIGDQKVGIGDEHHGDHHALAHAAGELVRIEREDALRIVDAHRLEHRERLLPRLGPRRIGVRPVGLDDLLAHGHHRIERVFRVLHHHRHAAAAKVAEVARGGGRGDRSRRTRAASRGPRRAVSSGRGSRGRSAISPNRIPPRCRAFPERARRTRREPLPPCRAGGGKRTCRSSTARSGAWLIARPSGRARRVAHRRAG